MPSGTPINYVSGGDRQPPLTPVTYQATPRPRGLNWGNTTTSHRTTHVRRPDGRPGPKPHPEVALMIQLYVEQQLSAPQVAEAIGCAPKTVRSNLRRAGVPLRDDRTGQNLPKVDR